MEIAWPLFLAASALLIITPGQDLLLVMSRAITQGQGAGVLTAFGISSGLVVHTGLAALGLGVILRTSAWLFLAMKLAGAVYLVYLGVQALRASRRRLALASAPPRSPKRLYLDGLVCNVANPKIAIFYLAFLPQFVTTGLGNPTASLLALGLSYAALSVLIKGVISLSAGRLSPWLRAHPGALAWLYRGSGAMLVGLGVKLALERRP